MESTNIYESVIKFEYKRTEYQKCKNEDILSISIRIEGCICEEELKVLILIHYNLMLVNP